MSLKKLDTLSAYCYLNNPIIQLNTIIDSWNAIVGPMETHGSACIKACKLDGLDVNAKHVFLGVCVSAAADKNCTVEDLEKEIVILEKEPWVKFGPRFQKWDGLTDNLPAWIVDYLEAPGKIEGVLNALEPLPADIEVGITKGPEDFAELAGMDKMKQIAQLTKIGKQMKSIATSIPENAKKVKADAEAMKEALESVKKLLEEKKLKEHGDTCSKANLVDVKDCYEKIYEPIPKASKKSGGAGGDGGCCTIF